MSSVCWFVKDCLFFGFFFNFIEGVGWYLVIWLGVDVIFLFLLELVLELYLS